MKNKKILNRDRIDTILSAVNEYPLTILEAPMGYGKTTAVKRFIDKRNIHAFWFTFSDFRNSEIAFWDSFTNDITKIDEQAGTILKSLGLPTDAPQMGKVLQILDSVDFDVTFLMVLDDYHLVNDMQLNRFFLRLAQEELVKFSILLITRDTTRLDFMELISKGQCYILPKQLLKFTEYELKDYCKMMLEDITDTNQQMIWQYTDGWISFAYIILLGLENGIPIGMSSNLENIIKRALFDNYDAVTQNFLLQLSVMEEFTAEQATFVTNQEESPQLLKMLEIENAFIYYDEQTGFYKIHTVLLNFLRMNNHFSEDELRTLYGRLGDWLMNRQDFLAAYSYLNRAGRSEDILAHLNNPKNIRNEWLDFEGADKMFNDISRERLFQYPFAYLLNIFYSILLGKENEILSWNERLDEMEQYYNNINDIDELYRNRILGEILIVRKFTLFNDLSAMCASDSEIVRLLNGQNSYITLQGNEFTFASPHYIYLYYRDKGSFRALADLLSKDVGYAKFSGGCGTGSDALALAEYALETGNFENIASQCHKAISKAKVMSQTSIIICANFTLIRLRLVEGNVSEAIRLLAEIELYVETMNNSIYNTTIDLCKGYIFACLGQPEQIPSWLQIGEIKVADFYNQGIAFNYIVYGKTLLALGKYDELEAQIEQFEKFFSVHNNRLGLIHNKIFKAAALYHSYGLEYGIPALQSALEEAQADSLMLPFAENTFNIIGMIKIIVQENPSNKFYNNILELCQKYESSIVGLSHTDITLSKREINILSLATIGLSRKEIANRLYISDGTVKTHFKNIYQKLGVNSKMAAIKTARSRGYLSMTEMQ